MSKELEALKRLEANVSDETDYFFNDECIKDYLIIENALKEYERYKPLIENIQNGLTDTISVEDLKVLIKRSKALKIIRNKKVDIHTLYRDSNIIGDTFDYYNNSMLVNRGIQYELTQEEYDLLKEVLL